MPEIGDIVKGKELGHKDHSRRYIWHACVDCGKERWVRLYKSGEMWGSKRCFHCSVKRNVYHQKRGALSTNWKGGHHITSRGYISLTLQPDNFFFPMTGKNGQVLEHRLVVAKAIGRCLHPWEHVHHKHTKYPAGSWDDKQDNSYPENLSLELINNHMQMTNMENIIKSLEQEIKTLKTFITKNGLSLRDACKH